MGQPVGCLDRRTGKSQAGLPRQNRGKDLFRTNCLRNKYIEAARSAPTVFRSLGEKSLFFVVQCTSRNILSLVLIRPIGRRAGRVSSREEFRKVYGRRGSRRRVIVVVLLCVDVHTLSALSRCRCRCLLLFGNALYPRVHILPVIHLEGLRLGASVFHLGARNGDARVLNR